MLTKSSIACIPGWGFKPSLLKDGLCLKESILINLPDIKELTLNRVAQNVSYLIPNNTTIIGWSLGGLIGIMLAVYFPKKVKKLVLLSCSPRFTQKARWIGMSSVEVNKFIELAENNIVNLFDYFLTLVNYPNRATCYRHLLLSHSLNCLEHRKVLLRYLRILFKSDVRKIYKSITVPLFLVFGKQDPVVRLNLEKLYDLNPKAIMHAISGSGHLAFLTHKESYYSQLIEFINYAE
ncbi:alpha/beta fold hydrolase [Coxiella endosymbiont of Amblyomma americanum]|uniref:alpha/beta fold hydrolase n=1 Tax=Coxiella endosymbiont of Amblyomma americanum TaxID=325775 RepID=UPI00058012AD|nr:alpha/beta fold hydrolase [Coxiella endosymbiont of Amblyomma americanum]AJC50610.1 putative hydrolases or acyltransferases (alpha/beta hydrolase superfamily) [Coxiella endosymbiont of Amblyomma americanum]